MQQDLLDCGAFLPEGKFAARLEKQPNSIVTWVVESVGLNRRWSSSRREVALFRHRRLQELHLTSMGGFLNLSSYIEWVLPSQFWDPKKLCFSDWYTSFKVLRSPRTKCKQTRLRLSLNLLVLNVWGESWTFPSGNYSFLPSKFKLLSFDFIYMKP